MGCLEADREYPCRNWERRRHGRKKEYTTPVIKEIKMIPVSRENDSAGQQAQEKKRKVDWIEIEAIAAWIGLGYVIGFIVSTIFCIWAMGWL